MGLNGNTFRFDVCTCLDLLLLQKENKRPIDVGQLWIRVGAELPQRKKLKDRIEINQD